MQAAVTRDPVIVVGAGPGGLAAAWRLQRAGHPVRVLEADPTVGGRLQTTTREGFVVDRAASLVPSAYTQILRLVADAGLAGELVRGGSVIGFAKPGTIHYLDSAALFRDAARTTMLSNRAKLLMSRVFVDSLRLRSLMSYEDLSIAGDADTESAAQYAARRANAEIAEYVIDATIRSILGTRAEQVSVLEFFFSFTKILGSRMLSFRQGMGSYPRLLAAQLDDVVVNAEVVAVEETRSGVVVTWRDHLDTEHIDTVAGCVVAVPADRAAAIVPGLDPWRRDFLRRVDYTSTVSINAGLSAPPPGVPAFMVQVPSSVEDELTGVILEHNKAPGRVPPGKGGITTLTMDEAARRLTDLDDSTICDHLLGLTGKLLGPLPDVEWVQVNRWPRVVVRSHPGYYRQLREFHALRRHHDRRVQLAGDYFSSSNANTATAAAEAAARALTAALRRQSEVTAR